MSVPYSIVFSKLAQEKFDHFIHKNRKTGEQIAKAIDRLAANIRLGEPLTGQWHGYYKYRTGNYRIIYRLEHSQLIIYVITIDHRKDVYRQN